MGHFSAMVVYSLLVAIVFSLLSKEELQERIRYFLKMFAMFVGLSILAAWVMFIFPL
jgi:hypothetical protein